MSDHPKIIELPKDAEGREIPLDVAVLYNKDGNDLHTDRATYMRLTEDWWFFGHFGSHTDTHRIAASDLYLNPPDSWEKLEDDLDRVASYGEDSTPACVYARQPCAVCKFHGSDECTVAMCADIASRIRRLRGESR